MKTLYVVRHCKAEGQEADAPLAPSRAWDAEANDVWDAPRAADGEGSRRAA